MTVERVILWGFMASGKTAVGERAARLLGWEHVDLDEEIVRRTGRSIASIFLDEGEAAFRALEREVTADLIGRRRVVFSPGGGWVTQPAMLEQIPAGSVTVWLKVDATTVLSRLSTDRGGPERPLLSSHDPAARIRTLLGEREPLYARARHVISTDGRSVDDIAVEVAGFVRPPPYPSEEGSLESDG